MKHNQNDEASRQKDKGTSQQKQMPKGQEGHGQEKNAQHGASDHGHSKQEDQDDQGSKKHSGAGKSK